MTTINELVGKLAELEHEQWMCWAKNIMDTEDISDERRERWEKYMIPYDELPDDVKRMDRDWARRAFNIMSIGYPTLEDEDKIIVEVKDVDIDKFTKEFHNCRGKTEFITEEIICKNPYG